MERLVWHELLRMRFIGGCKIDRTHAAAKSTAAQTAYCDCVYFRLFNSGRARESIEIWQNYSNFVLISMSNLNSVCMHEFK